MFNNNTFYWVSHRPLSTGFDNWHPGWDETPQNQGQGGNSYPQPNHGDGGNQDYVDIIYNPYPASRWQWADWYGHTENLFLCEYGMI